MRWRPRQDCQGQINSMSYLDSISKLRIEPKRLFEKLDSTGQSGRPPTHQTETRSKAPHLAVSARAHGCVRGRSNGNVDIAPRHESSTGNVPFEGLPRGHFGAVVVDAPWRFETWSEKGKGRSAAALQHNDVG